MTVGYYACMNAHTGDYVVYSNNITYVIRFQCKHLLAMHLSIAMDKCEEQSVTDEDITTCLKHMD